MALSSPLYGILLCMISLICRVFPNCIIKYSPLSFYDIIISHIEKMSSFIRLKILFFQKQSAFIFIIPIILCNLCIFQFSVCSFCTFSYNIYIIPVFSVSFHLRLREVLVFFNDWQIVVRTVYYYSIVSYNYNRQLSVSEGLPYNLFRSVPANPPSLYIVTLRITAKLQVLKMCRFT